jgi:hypothetical protein
MGHVVRAPMTCGQHLFIQEQNMPCIFASQIVVLYYGTAKKGWRANGCVGLSDFEELDITNLL